MFNNSYYGRFRQNTFSEVHANTYATDEKRWDEAANFLADWKASYFYTSTHTATFDLVSDSDITLIYYLLYSNYANSVVASSDENRFKLNLFSIIYQYAPTWLKKLDIQKKLRGLSDADIAVGTKAIHNAALNPQTTPGTASLTELEYINQQNTTTYKKSKIDAYGSLWEMLATDVTDDFIKRFKPLFLTIVQPEGPLWYVVSDVEEDEGDD